ncbi:lipoprotein [Streptomyces sp. NPDC048045]|uniref:lipoprotein n=1 Tax=Streptomyces sp. NPDC048045 TaxID=3154710 RepID=UPI00344979A9
MQVRVGSVRGRVIQAVFLAVALGGCAGSADGGATASGNPSAGSTGAKGAPTANAATASGGTIGASGSACELPVSFDIAKDWKAKGIDAERELSKASKGAKGAKGSDGDVTGAFADAFLRQGPVTTACEIDAKPAGKIGFLRVWTGKPGNADTRTVLRQFVAAEDNTSKETYRSFKTSDGVSGVEVDYLYTSKLLEETKKERALAVSTPDGPVVLHLGGLDTEEHKAMLPAYELAKQTLRIL